jgi:hypothetical protein
MAVISETRPWRRKVKRAVVIEHLGDLTEEMYAR